MESYVAPRGTFPLTMTPSRVYGREGVRLERGKLSSSFVCFLARLSPFRRPGANL